MALANSFIKKLPSNSNKKRFRETQKGRKKLSAYSLSPFSPENQRRNLIHFEHNDKLTQINFVSPKKARDEAEITK
jgi:hypothetical protein